MKDGLMSAEVRAASVSGTLLYAGNSMSGTRVFASADMTAGTGVTSTAGNMSAAAGSIIALAGSIGSNLDVGSLTQYN